MLRRVVACFNSAIVLPCAAQRERIDSSPTAATLANFGRFAPFPPTKCGFQVHEIICPNCGRAFAIDETGYADILKQVGDRDLEKELHERLEPAERDKKNNLKLAQAHAEAEWVKLLSELGQAKAETTSAVELDEAKLAAKLEDRLAEKAAKVEKLKASIQASEQARQLAVIDATTRVEKERDRLKADLELAEARKALGEKALQERYEQQIKDRDDAIERLRDMKAKLSTKMVGEALELRCEIEFNRLRHCHGSPGVNVAVRAN